MTVATARGFTICAFLWLACSACRAGSVLGVSFNTFGPAVTAGDSGLVNPASLINFDNSLIAREDPVRQFGRVAFGNFYYSTSRAAGVLPSGGYISNFSNESITPQAGTIVFDQPVSQLSFELRSQAGTTDVEFSQKPGVSGIISAALSTDLGGNDYYSFLNVGAVTSLTISTTSSDNGFVLDNLAFGVGPSDVSNAAPLPSSAVTGTVLLALLCAPGVMRCFWRFAFWRICFTPNLGLLVSPVAAVGILAFAAHANADSMLFQDNFDSGNLSGWIEQSAGGNNGGQVFPVSSDYFNPGQNVGHNIYLLAANINVPSSTPAGFGFVVLDHGLGASAAAGTTYNLNIDQGLLAESFGKEAPDVNYGVQLWASQPGTTGSTLLWEMAVNGANQIMTPPAIGDWTTWNGSYTATASTPGGELWLRLFSIDSAGSTLPDAVAWDNVSVSTTAAPLPSNLSGILGLAGVIAIGSLLRRRSAGIQIQPR